MFSYIVRRLLQAGVVVLLITVVTFMIIHLAPGGPSMLLGEHLSEADRQQMRENLGLDQPLHIQYIRWLTNILQGELGRSFTKGEPVVQVLLDRLPNTALLAAAALTVSTLIAIPIGVMSAVRRYSVWDHAGTFIAFFGVSIPSFWLAIMLIIAFSVRLQWLPSSGMSSLGVDFSLADRARHLVMPVTALAIRPVAEIVRYTRSGMLDALQGDYVRTARAKGLAERVVIYHHSLRNAMIPILTVIGLLIPPLIGGSVIVESIFGWPGMGRLAIDAALRRDYPVVMGITVVVSIVVALVNLIFDLLYGVVDPRVRYQ